jgi:diguanylate cyclase (GGDEF)-like protein/PAS domain S-box-containing protein
MNDPEFSRAFPSGPGSEPPTSAAVYDRAAFELAPVGIVHVALDGRRLRVNPRFCAMLGYTAAELLEQDFLEHMHPEDRAGLLDNRRRLIAGEIESYSMRRRYRRRGGDWLWTETRASLARHPDGTPAFLVAIIEDIGERMRAEDALAGTQAMLAAVFETAAIGISVVAIDGRRLRVNEALCRMTGHSQEALLARNYAEDIHPEDRELVSRERARLIRGELDRYTIERRFRHRQGNWFWTRVAVSLVRGADGRPLCTVTAVEDITERRIAEEAYARTQAMLLGMFEVAAVGMVIADPGGRRLRVNRRFCEFLGDRESELLALRCRDQLHPDDVAQFDAERARMLAGETPGYSLVCRMRHRDGHWVWMQTTVSLVRDAEGRARHTIAVCDDVSERRRAEEALRESESRYRTMFDGVGVGITLMTPDGRRIEANRTLAAMLGYTSEELLALSAWDLTHPDERAEFAEWRRQLIAGEISSLSIERRYLRRDGSWMWGGLTVTVVRGADGAPQYTLAAVRDISDRRAAQHQLEASEERFRKLLELSSDWYWEQDEQLRYTRFEGNRRSQDTLLFADCIGRTQWQLPWLDVDESTWIEHRRALEAREPFRNLVLRRLGSDATVHWISISGEPVYAPDGGFLGYRGVSSDVSADHAAAAALRASEARARELADIVDQSREAIVTTDLDNLVRTWNRGAERLYGHAAGAALGRDADELLGSEPGAHDLRQGIEAVRGGQSEVRHARHRTRDGRVLEVEIGHSPLTDAEGRLIGRIAVSRDLSERIEFERALRESELRNRLLALVFDQTSDAIAITDLDNLVVAWNPAAEALYGHSAAEALGRDLTRLTRPDASGEEVGQRIAEIRAQRTQVRCATERTRDGAQIVVEATLSPLYDERGRHIGEIGIARNMTEQVRAERQLRESEARNRLLAATVEQSSDAIVTKDLDNTVLTWNRGAEAIFGYRAQEAVGRNFTMLTNPRPDRERIAEGVARVRRGEPGTWRGQRRRKDGALITVDVSVTPLHDEHGRHIGEIGTVRDVSARVLAEEALRDSERRNRELALIVDQSRDAILTKDLDNRVTTWNRGASALLGHPPTEAIGRLYPDLVSPQASDDERAADLARLRRAEAAIWETERRGPDGTTLHIEVSVAPLYDAGGRHIGEVAVLRDISARKHAERALREQQLLLEQAQSIGQIGSWSLTLSGERRLAWSREMFRIFGIAERQFDGTSADFLARVHPEDRARVEAAVDSAIATGGGYSIELRILRADGELRWVNERATVERDAAGTALRLIGVSQDITERKLAEQRIEFLATRDPLTELPNRLLLNERITQGMASAERNGTQLALLFIDLDRFKTINDSLGHRIGDLMLQHVAARLRRCVRKEDTLARLGGDEFMVILDGLRDAAAAAQVARKILRLLSRPYLIDGHQLNTSCSVGISLYPADGQDVQTLMKNADTAMYHAKERGRNNYQYFSAELNARVVERLSIENALRRAVERGEFSIVYQPQVRLASSLVVGVEALLRWRSPDRGMQGPGRFIAVAEESGLIEPIGEWVLHHACEQGARWTRAGHDGLRLAVNVSVRQLTRGFARTVARVLAATGFDPRRLELEVTESVLMQHADESIAILKRIRELGVQFAIDDFGIGYSSLSYLKRFPIDALKIDRTFIRDIATDPDDAAITSAVTAIGHSMGLRVCAEGVETKDQLRMLRVMNCDEYQGHLYSRAVAPEEFAERFLAPKLL